jgi:hypothetical protein
MVLVTIGCLLFVMIGEPGPTMMGHLDLEKPFVNIHPVSIEPRFVEFDGYFDIFNIMITEDNAPCGTKCSPLDFTVTMTINDGILRFNPSYDSSSITLI